MADGWLFRLRSTLGARHAVPAWPASSPLEPRVPTADAAAREWPALRDARAPHGEHDDFAATEPAPAPLRKP